MAMPVTHIVIGVLAVAIATVVGRRIERAATPTGTEFEQRDQVERVDRSLEIDDLLERHRVGVTVLAPGGSVVYRNTAAREFDGTHVGFLLDEVIERLGARAIAGDDLVETIEMYGPPRTVFVVDAQRRRSGGAVVFVDDISERRRLDQIRTDFVANVSHELKTPIGALSLLAETLEDEDDPATVARIATRMRSETERAARTIDDLLELSRVESGTDRTAELVTVDEIVGAAIERCAELALNRSIGISTLDPVLPDGHRAGAAVITGDRRQLQSALGNLVENATRYSLDGSTVQVRMALETGWVEISVIDRGVGIPQRDLDRIFERFYRVDRARSRGTGGTGLGLAIVRHVVSSHGGQVTVSSIEGEGSTFRVRFPVDVVIDSSSENRAGEAGVA